MCVVGGVSVLAAVAISATTAPNCGSCRAPARLRRRRYCWHLHRLTLRFRGLAKARRLPQGMCVVGGVSVLAAVAISATTAPNCGSCRALARLRRRRYCWHLHRLTHRFRGLAKARRLPQGMCVVGGVSVLAAVAMSASTAPNCGSCRAPARLRRRRYCRHHHRLTQRYHTCSSLFWNLAREHRRDVFFLSTHVMQGNPRRLRQRQPTRQRQQRHGNQVERR